MGKGEGGGKVVRVGSFKGVKLFCLDGTQPMGGGERAQSICGEQRNVNERKEVGEGGERGTRYNPIV